VTGDLVAGAGWITACVAGAAGLGAWRSLIVRSERVARASHELRGPLAAARLGLELCARAGECSPARLRAVELELARACLALEDLGAVGRSQSAGSRASEVDVAELLSESVEAWRPTAAARGAELSLTWLGPPARVRADRLRIAQATGNLIANAIEHGGGAVAVRGRVDGAVVRIEITDSGPGLRASVSKLARQARGGRGRRGRGLAIATGIATAHGGRLAAAPSDGGARLVLELPITASDTPAETAPAGER
jgi:signal transduction histidine kinase